MFRGLSTVLFLSSLCTVVLCLAYLSDTSGHKRSFVELELAAEA